MTEDRRCRIKKNEHCAVQKYIFWGPITEAAFVDYSFHTGRGDECKLTEKEMEEIEKFQQKIPVQLLPGYWYFHCRFYRHNEPTEDSLLIKGLIIQQQRRKKARDEQARKIGQQAEAE